MRAGDLDQQVRFEAESRADDGYGGSELTWQALGTHWAQVTAVRGTERAQAMSVEYPFDYKVRVRRVAALRAAKRLVWTSNGDMELRVIALEDNGPRAGDMWFHCRAGVR